MGKKSPQAPPAPDPVATAQAQTQSNEATARLEQKLNNVNTSSPYGTVTYNQFAPDRWSQDTVLSPGQQAIYDKGTSAQIGALDVANQQIGRVGDALNAGFDTSNLPALQGNVQSGQLQTGVQGGQYQTGFDQGPGVQSGFNIGGPLAQGFDQGQAVQGQVGPTDFSADRNAVTDSVWNQARSRLDPLWNQQQSHLDTQLANQGIGLQSTAYGNAQDQLGRSRNDAYNTALYGAIQQGANEQNQLFGQSLAQGQFANQAAGQQYSQNQGLADFQNQAAMADYQRNAGLAQFQNQAAGQQYAQNQGAADFANQATGQQFAQNVAQGQFANQATGQQFSQDAQAAQLANQARNQGFQEQAYQQNLPVNLFNALMSSSQVQSPQGVQYSPVGVAPTDVLGAYALNSQVANQNYQAQVQQQNALLGGLSQLGGSAIMAFSDARLKRDIRRVGERNGLGVYLYRYLWSPVEYIGVMAQEVLAKKPEAVVNVGGYLAVNYGML